MDIRPANQAVVPVILGLRQKGQPVIAARAINVGLVMQTAEKLVFTAKQQCRALADRARRFAALGHLGNVYLELEAMFLSHARIAKHAV